MFSLKIHEQYETGIFILSDFDILWYLSPSNDNKPTDDADAFSITILLTANAEANVAAVPTEPF